MKNKTCTSVTLEPSRGICHTWSHAGTRLSVKPEPSASCSVYLQVPPSLLGTNFTSSWEFILIHQNESTPVFNQSGQEVVSPTLEQVLKDSVIYGQMIINTPGYCKTCANGVSTNGVTLFQGYALSFILEEMFVLPK